MFNFETGPENLGQNKERIETEKYDVAIEKIEKAEKEDQTEQENLMEELSEKEVSIFQKTKEKVKKGCKIGIIGTMIVTSLLAVGCGAEQPQELDHWSQVNIEEARKSIPDEITEGWVNYGLRSIGSWKEDEQGFLVMIGSGRRYYRITQENLEEFKQRMSDEINQFLYYSIMEEDRNKNITGKLLNEMIKSFFPRYVERAMEDDATTIAYDLFEKASSSDWQQLEDYIYFGVEELEESQKEAEEVEESQKKDEVRQGPDLSDLDPTLK